MPARQAKRPYAGSQSQITSYFTPGTTSLPAPPTPSQYQPPTLPNQIQSSLLSVGMRIRKSVPEGYKTGSYSAFNLFSDTTPVTKSNFASASPSSAPAAPKYKGTRPRWGMSVQGYHESGETIEDEDEEDYEGRIWDSSQESMLSNDSVGSYGGGNGSKRRFVDEEDGENAFGQGGNGGEL
ncbi:ribonucleotide reductase inhibitor [Botrytis cinerea]